MSWPKRVWDIPDISGQKHGRWTVVHRVPLDQCPALKRRDRRSSLWLCRCDCGTERIVSGSDLRTKRTVSCGCLFKEKLAAGRLRPYEATYNLLRANARRYQQPVELTYDEFAELALNTCCHYCGAPIEFQPVLRQGRVHSNYFVDRKDSSLGYSRDNCVACCGRCNLAKNKFFSYEEWVKIGALIRSWTDSVAHDLDGEKSV